MAGSVAPMLDAHRQTASARGCESGRELIDAGYADDVEIAAELDHSPSVPVLSGGAFRG